MGFVLPLLVKFISNSQKSHTWLIPASLYSFFLHFIMNALESEFLIYLFLIRWNSDEECSVFLSSSNHGLLFCILRIEYLFPLSRWDVPTERGLLLAFLRKMSEKENEIESNKNKNGIKSQCFEISIPVYLFVVRRFHFRVMRKHTLTVWTFSAEHHIRS